MGLQLKSDVVNDLQQAADMVGSPGKALAELVWNSVQYQPEGQRPDVRVELVRTGKRVTELVVRDNGRGMDLQDLQRFFTLHAANVDREAGRLGRGRFGTGAKAASFAVADELVVETVRGGTRTTATLRRRDLLRHRVDIDTRQERTKARDGTTIRLRHLRVRRFAENATRDYLIRSLGRALLEADVRWGRERLQYREPPYGREWVRDATGRELEQQVGKIRLVIRLADSWLSEDQAGVTITSLLVPHEHGYLGPLAGSSWSGLLYGAVEVPKLEEPDREGRPAYTAERSLRLNRDNLRVQTLLDWLDRQLDEVGQELDREAQARQDQARQERLQEAARSVEGALNRRLHAAFAGQHVHLGGALAGRGPADQLRLVQQDDAANRWVSLPGGEPQPPALEGAAPAAESAGREGEEGAAEPPVPTRPPGRRDDPDGDRGLRANEPDERAGRRDQIRVEPRQLGPDGPKAHYSREGRVIYVNVDHPQLAACGGPDQPAFRLMLAAAAAEEFALAVTALRIEVGDPEVDPASWPTVLTAVRREASLVGAELAAAIRLTEQVR